MIRYPAFSKTRPGQYGVGPHSDFGGVTCLLQEANKEGLEVWIEEEQAWLPVPAVEDVYVSKSQPTLSRQHVTLSFRTRESYLLTHWCSH